MVQMSPANIDITAPILSIAGVSDDVDKFMGITQFMYESPADTLEPHPGTIVGSEMNREVNKATFSFGVHSTSIHRGQIEELVRKGVMVKIVCSVEKGKRDVYKAGQIVEQGCQLGLITGGGSPLGGKNEGVVTFQVKAMNAYELALGKDGDTSGTAVLVSGVA